MMGSRAIFAVAMCSLLFLGGCSKDRTFGAAPSVEVTDLDMLPEPGIGDSAVVAAFEKLDIRVIGAEGLAGTYAVEGDGSLRFPFVGEMSAAGKTTAQLAREITDGLRGRYIRDPQVVVRSEKELQLSISIGGQVENPGTYDAGTSRTLIRAVNNAGGLAKYAQTDDVLVMRKVNGRSYIGVYNMEAIERGNYADPSIFPNDIIMVGDSPSRRLLESILQFSPLLATSVVLVDQVRN